MPSLARILKMLYEDWLRTQVRYLVLGVAGGFPKTMPIWHGTGALR